MPILIGGHAKPALRRAARVADGFIHAGGSFEELAATVEQIDEYRREYGRDHLPFEYQSMGAEAFSIDGVRKLEDLGIQEAIVAFRNPYAAEPDTQTLEEKVRALNRFADTVIRKGGTLLTVDDIKPGDRVHVKANIEEDESLTAFEIMLQKPS